MRKYEARQGSYFATPPVQAIMALDVSLGQLLAQGMDARFAAHATSSRTIKDTVEGWGLRLVPAERGIAANTLSAIYLPAGITAPELLKHVGGQGVMIAGGLHPQHAASYFRVGHMNVSTLPGSDHVDRTLGALKHALTATGYKFAGQA
jgi:alanine-glyoxylate transaminase/serine-glyoxylate transaminase/serine-pyruvate transaminase